MSSIINKSTNVIDSWANLCDDSDDEINCVKSSVKSNISNKTVSEYKPVISRQEKKQATRERLNKKIQEIKEKNEKVIKEVIVERERKILENDRFNRYYKNDIVDKVNGIIISQTEQIAVKEVKKDVSNEKSEETSDDSSDCSSDDEFKNIVSITKNSKMLDLSETKLDSIKHTVTKTKVSKKTIAEIRQENKEKLYDILKEIEMKELEEEEREKEREKEREEEREKEREKERERVEIEEEAIQIEKPVSKPIVDMKAHFYKTNPCKFGSKCTRKECYGYHSEKDRRLPRCLYNLECRNENCTFIHDGEEEEWLAKNPIQVIPIQVEQTVTRKETVKQVKKPIDMKAHFHKTNPCKFGSKCTRKECSGYHSEKDRRLPRCLYNLECKNINCEFVHDGQEKEWLARNPIQKC